MCRESVSSVYGPGKKILYFKSFGGMNNDVPTNNNQNKGLSINSMCYGNFRYSRTCKCL